MLGAVCRVRGRPAIDPWDRLSPRLGRPSPDRPKSSQPRDLPKPFDRKRIEHRFLRYKQHVFRLRLCNEHTVEWILVVDVHPTCQPGMMKADGQFAKTLASDDHFEVMRQHGHARQFADPELP